MTSETLVGEGSRSRPSADCWQARIVDASGSIRGTGVLISDRHVLTCAHVLSGGADQPTEEFTVEFPRSSRRQRVRGRVATGCWLPEGENGRGDVALLEIDGVLDDPRVRPARLGVANGSYGRPGLAYGHPVSAPDGMWSRVEISDSTGPFGERVQLTGRLGNPGDAIVRGFSGGPVIDEVTEMVIGIVASTLTDSGWIAGWMIPMETVADYLRQVQDAMSVSGGAEREIDRTELDQVADLFGRLHRLASPSGRQMVAERLPRGPRGRLPHPPPTVRDLVYACSRPSELRVLADLIRYFDTYSLWDNRFEKQLELLGVETTETARGEVEELAAATRLDLRRALVEVPYFRDTRTRHIYLDAFERRLRDERNVTLRLSRTDDAVVDADVLLDECLRTAGAFREIPKDFPLGGHDRPEFQAVVVLIDFLTEGRLLLDRERAELLVLIRHQPDAAIRAAWRRAQSWDSARAGAPADALTVIREIEGWAQRPGGLPRIVEFTEVLALRLDTSAADELRAWSDRVAARQRLPREEVEAFRERLAESRAATRAPVLAIQLVPDALQPRDQFLLEAVLEYGGRQRVVASSDEPDPLDAVRERLDVLLDEVYDVLDEDVEMLTVEVIVPRVLLTEPIDQWMITEAMPVPIGEKFPVVLRSLERLRARRLWLQWGSKWRLVKEQHHGNASVMHYLGPGDTPTSRQVYESLSPDGKLALVLGRPLNEQAALDANDIIAGALQAGVAYVAWVRDVSLADGFRRAMEQILADVPIRELPAKVAAWRAPGAAEAPIGRHTSLMACDHDRREPFAGRNLAPPRRRPS